MDFKSGKQAKAVIDGTEPAITGWSINPSTEIVTFRNSKTGNYSKKEPTFLDAEGSLELDMDFDANVFDTPLSLAPGLRITNMKLYLDGTSGLYWDIPEAIIKDTPQSVEVDGKIKTTINFTVDGAWTAP